MEVYTFVSEGQLQPNDGACPLFFETYDYGNAKSYRVKISSFSLTTRSSSNSQKDVRLYIKRFSSIGTNPSTISGYPLYGDGITGLIRLDAYKNSVYANKPTTLATIQNHDVKASQGLLVQYSFGEEIVSGKNAKLGFEIFNTDTSFAVDYILTANILY
jgi:hypothetical protein